MTEGGSATLARQRAETTARREQLRGSVTKLRADFAPQALGQRLAAAAKDEVGGLAQETRAVALANIPVIALTGAALALWLARRWLAARIGVWRG